MMRLLPFAFLVASALNGQERAPAAAVIQPVRAVRDTAVLLIHNRQVIVFRASLGARSPAERATAAADKARAAVASDATDSISVRTIPEGRLILVDQRPLFTVTPGDVDALANEQLDELTARVVQRLRVALDAAIEEQSLTRFLWASGLAITATLAFLVVLRLLRWSRRRALVYLRAKPTLTTQEFAVGGFTILSAEGALALVRRIADVLFWAGGLFAAYLWLAFVLTRFSYSRPWGEALGAYLTDTIRTLALTALQGLPGLFTVVLIVIVTRALVRLVSSFFDAVEQGSVDIPWIHPETANPTKRIAMALLWLFALIVAYPYLPGSGSDVFKGVTVFTGLVLSLGSSGVVNQAMSGLVLMYSRALKPGDFVRIGEIEGTVTALGMLSTKIRTTKHEEITIPNSVVVTTNVKNYSRLSLEEGVILYTSVTIGYDTPWRQVEAMLLLAASRTPGIRSDPKPFVLHRALSDFYIEYELNVYIDNPALRNRILSQLHVQIVDAFNEYGVQILSPHYESDPKSPAVVPPDKWHLAPAPKAPA